MMNKMNKYSIYSTNFGFNHIPTGNGLNHEPLLLDSLVQIKLWKSLKQIFLENSFNKDKSVGLEEIPCTKKFLKFALDVELAQLKFTYITVLK